MPKRGGKKYKRTKRGDTSEHKRELLLKDDSNEQEYGKVIKLLGQGRMTVHCFDGKVRTCKVRGTMMKRVYVNLGDIVLISKRSYEPEKGDIIHKYNDDDTRQLRKEGHIPEDIFLSEETEGGERKEEEEPTSKVKIEFAEL